MRRSLARRSRARVCCWCSSCKPLSRLRHKRCCAFGMVLLAVLLLWGVTVGLPSHPTRSDAPGRWRTLVDGPHLAWWRTGDGVSTSKGSSSTETERGEPQRKKRSPTSSHRPFENPERDIFTASSSTSSNSTPSSLQTVRNETYHTRKNSEAEEIEEESLEHYYPKAPSLEELYLRPFLWPDEAHREAPPEFMTIREHLGEVEREGMPYPKSANMPPRPDNVSMRDIVQDSIYFFDYTGDMLRSDLLRVPTVYHLGVESFAGLRLSAFTHSGLYVAETERRALLAHQKASSSIAEVQGRAEEEREAFAWYYSYDHNHERVVSFLSPENVSVPKESSPKSFVLSRMIQGDAMFDTFGIQMMDRQFPCERGIAFSVTNYFCDVFVELMHLSNEPPLVLNIHKMHVFHFALRCLYYRTQSLTDAKRKLVLLSTELDETPGKTFFWDMDIRPTDFPEITVSYLLNHPLLAHWYSTNGNIRHPKFTALPIGFHFYFRSESYFPMLPDFKPEREEIHSNYTRYFLGHLNLGQMFPHITSHEIEFGSMTTMWVERALEVFTGSTVDAPIEVIPLDQLPERITTIYIVLMPIERQQRPDRPSLTNDILIFQEPINEEDEDCLTSLVQHIALLPFTAAMYHTLTQNPHGDPKRPLKIVAGFNIWHWRWPWFDWINKTDIGVFPLYGQDRFYEMISRTAFVASPPGNGYECFRTWEALTLGSIPVISNPVVLEGLMMQVGGQGELDSGKEVNTRALMEVYRDLPVIFIDMVTDMTMANMEKWRREIYHRARHGKYKFEKLFLQYWVDRIYGHSNDEE